MAYSFLVFHIPASVQRWSWLYLFSSDYVGKGMMAPQPAAIPGFSPDHESLESSRALPIESS